MRQILINSEFSSFADFHDGKWYEKLFALSKDSVIERAVEDFSTHWWGASRAFVLPWLLVNGVFDASNGGNEQIASKQELWNQYLSIASFNVALWKVAEGAYISIYYAYENFLVNLINIDREPVCRVTDRNFSSILSDSIGESIASKVWNNSFVAVSKEVRNCIVHRGGTASPALLRMTPLPKIERGSILISASDVRQLHKNLKSKVELLIKHYVNNTNS